MTASRAESQQPQYGRRRSNTAQSTLRSLPPVSPLKLGDSKWLNAWVHDPKESSTVIFNQSWWPGVAEGDMIRITGNDPDGTSDSGYLFVVPKDEYCAKQQLQISIPKPVADAFGWRNNCEVIVTKVEKDKCCAEYVEFIFQDQYLGRNDMWRLGEHLVDQCVYANQELTFIGTIAAKIQNIYINGKQVSAACMTPFTKAIYRSLSAKVTIFIQVCKELWEFAGDGERYYEKIVHSFLPALFTKWREAGTNHTVTIVLISRVIYDQTETDYAEGPLRKDEEGKWCKDFFKVITDLEVIHEWRPTLVSLKDSFWDFQRDILLTHHYHRASLDPAAFGPAEQVRLVGKLSFAHDGPILEALNLSLNPTETHYIDRSLSLTGATTILITPGTGYYRVSKQLLRLTTTRMLDQGFGLDVVSLAKPPLHQSPIFSFQGVEPELRMDRDGKYGSRAMDPLWGGDDESSDPVGREKINFWWEPFFISISFWDQQMDLPFRKDRFIARAKMHEIQMLGLLEHDVLSSIEVPFLPSVFSGTPQDTGQKEEADKSFKAETEKFDLDIFKLKTEFKPANLCRSSYNSSGSGNGTIVASSYRSVTEHKRSTTTHRTSIIAARIPAIEESPGRNFKDLPVQAPSESNLIAPALSALSTSPSQSSMRSARSSQSGLSASSSKIVPLDRHSREASGSSRTSKAKFAPAWLFNPFRGGLSEPQTSSVSASSSSTPTLTTNVDIPSSPLRVASTSSFKSTVVQNAVSRPPKPVAIKQTFTSRSTLRSFDDENVTPVRTSFNRLSPEDTPREEPTFGKRRSGTMSSTMAPLLSSSLPNRRTNPSQPSSSVPDAQSSLARRWQHIFPHVLFKHEIKWKSLVTPGCLPITVEQFPTTAELESSYDVFSYDFVVDPREMRSFLVQPPVPKRNPDDMRRAWALVVMRGMAAVRLAQGFQFVLRPQNSLEAEGKGAIRRSKSFVEDDETPKLGGAAQALRSTDDPVYLSMSNEIHRISYTGEVIQVRRYVRRMPPTEPFEYQCLIWPKLGGGYTELSTSFTSRGLENYGWNRLDMLVAGYEHQFNESLRYWRTRFIVIPTMERPLTTTGPSGELLDDEETRILGIEKLAEQFSKMRWLAPDERGSPAPPPVRFLPTTLGPAQSVLDESLMTQLDEIHAAGPLRKKMKSEREIEGMSLSAIAKAMREDDGVPIKFHQWHGNQYPNSFTGYDFVSWLVREFRDVSSRVQGADWGTKLHDQGLFEHVRGQHNFLDGHYFYRLKGEYSVVMTPRGWFRSGKTAAWEDAIPRISHYPGSAIPSTVGPRRNKKRLILSQSMVIDIDPNKRSDQAETVILHHDIIHNPATVFHFELQWIGTTARCIEDQLRIWGRTIEKYGLKLVEAYVTQISDIRDRNAFQSCYPLRLARAPPDIPGLAARIPDGAQAAHYFEYALLRRFGFILDVEAAELYPAHVDVVYSYRRSAFDYSQFVHRSGVAFVQVLGGAEGFTFLTNRLMGPGRMGTAVKSKDQRLTAAAEEIRVRLHQFCSDEQALEAFYQEELARLRNVEEEPPPLTI